jgi:hypothetical protein
LCLRTLLGLDVVDGTLRSKPLYGDMFGKLTLRGVRVRGRPADTP